MSSSRFALSLSGFLCAGLCLLFALSVLGLAIVLVGRSRKNKPEV